LHLCVVFSMSAISAVAQTTTDCMSNGFGGISCTTNTTKPSSIDFLDAFTKGAEEANNRAWQSQQMNQQIQQMQQLQEMQKLQQQQIEMQQYQQQQYYLQQLQQRKLNSENVEMQRAQSFENKGPSDLIHVENSIVANRWTSYHIHKVSKFQSNKLTGAKFTLIFGDLVNWAYERTVKQNYVVNCKKPSEVFLVIGNHPNGVPILNSYAFDFPAETSAGKSAVAACKKV
jgi:hypothetical protein